MNMPDHETPVALVYQRELSPAGRPKRSAGRVPPTIAFETLGSSETPLTKAELAEKLGKGKRTVDGYIAAKLPALELFVRAPDGTFCPATDDDKTASRSCRWLTRRRSAVPMAKRSRCTGAMHGVQPGAG